MQPAGAAYQAQLCVQWIGILGADNLVQVIGRREATWDYIVLVQDGDICVACLCQLVRSCKTEAARAEYQYRLSCSAYGSHIQPRLEICRYSVS
jgi:hypothetical protein